MTNQQKSLMLILLVSFLGATLGVAVKLGIQEMPPLGFVTSRVVLSLLFILPLIFKTKLWRVKNKLRLFGFASLATANITLFVIGISRTAVSISAALYAATPLLSSIFSQIFYHEKLTSRKMAGIVSGLIGTIMIVLMPVIVNHKINSDSLLGNIIIFLAVIIFSLYTSLSQKMHRQFSPAIITQAFIVISVVILLPLAIWEMRTQTLWLANLNLKSILTMLYVSAIGTVGFYFLYQYAIKKSSPLVASLTMYLQPIFTVILAIPIFSEHLTPEFVFGTLLTLIGVWLVTGAKTRPSQTSTA